MSRRKSRSKRDVKQKNWPLWAGFAAVAGFFAIWMAVAAIGKLFEADDTLVEQIESNDARTSDLDRATRQFVSGVQKQKRGLRTLPVVEGWNRGNLIVGATEEDDLSCDYTNGNTLARFFQVSRRQTMITDELQHPVVRREFALAKKGFEMLVESRVATGVKEGPIERHSLGATSLECMHQTVELTSDQGNKRSDIYVWTFENRILKLIVTGPSGRSESDWTQLDDLLAAFANACLNQLPEGTDTILENLPADAANESGD